MSPGATNPSSLGGSPTEDQGRSRPLHDQGARLGSGLSFGKCVYYLSTYTSLRLEGFVRTARAPHILWWHSIIGSPLAHRALAPLLLTRTLTGTGAGTGASVGAGGASDEFGGGTRQRA